MLRVLVFQLGARSIDRNSRSRAVESSIERLGATESSIMLGHAAKSRPAKGTFWRVLLHENP